MPSILPSTSPVTTLGVPTFILVTTGTGNFDGGYLDVLVNTGNGYIAVTSPGVKYSNGQVVLDACYEGFVDLQVTNPETNAWALGALKLRLITKSHTCQCNV